jgi:hypothetical protein
MLGDEKISNQLAADEMLLDNPFQDWWVAAPVPCTLGIYERDRPTFADAKAIGLCTENAALLRKLELL